MCPHCGALEAYDARRPNDSLHFRDFTLTAGTLFASHKLPLKLSPGYRLRQKREWRIFGATVPAVRRYRWWRTAARMTAASLTQASQLMAVRIFARACKGDGI
jgi:hypothetical protein